MLKWIIIIVLVLVVLFVAQRFLAGRNR